MSHYLLSALILLSVIHLAEPNCVSQSGDSKPLNQEWVEQNAFILVCEKKIQNNVEIFSGRIIACLTPSNIRVPIGSSTVADQSRYECTRSGSGARLRTRTAVGAGTATSGDSGSVSGPQQGEGSITGRTCLTPYKTLKVGEEFDVFGVMVIRCKADGRTDIVGCVIPNSNSRVYIGDDPKVAGNRQYSCIRSGTGVTLKPSAIGSTVDTGPGSVPKWITGNAEPCVLGREWDNQIGGRGGFRLRCENRNGVPTAVTIACLSPDGDRITIGSTLTRGTDTFNCLGRDQGGPRLVVYGLADEQGSANPPLSSNTGGLFNNISLVGVGCPGSDGVKNHGAEWNGANFVMRCEVEGLVAKSVPVACLTPSGKRVEKNDTLQDGNDFFQCESNGRGGLRMRSQLGAGPACTLGRETVDTRGDRGGFIQRCITKDGRPQQSTIACLSPQGDRIAVGQSLTRGTDSYQCIKEGELGAKLRVFGLPDDSNTNAGSIPRQPPGNQQDQCISPCFPGGGRLCSGEERISKRFTSGDTITGCQNGNLFYFCKVNADNRNQYSVSKGMYTIVGDQLLICATFDDTPSQVEPSRERNSESYRKLLQDYGYVYATPKVV